MIAAAVLAISACANTAIDGNFSTAQTLTRQHLGADVQWLQTDAARQQAERDTQALLTQPLSADDAVRIALAYSPAVQALLYDAAAESAAATQSARLPNPVLAFERLLRHEGGTDAVEINRALSVSVLDLLLLPSRSRSAEHRQQALRIGLAASVVQAAGNARQAWVVAVAAQQSLQYVEQVKTSADASAELARRMRAVGNFSALQQAREQAFAADAVVQLAHARQTALGAREALVRALGLGAAQAVALQLPDRLPDLPMAPRDEADIAAAANQDRLDLQLARAELAYLAREQGLATLDKLAAGSELSLLRNSESGRPSQKGYGVQLPLPVFDLGDASRARASASYLAAFNRTAQLTAEAQSQLRERHAGYLGAYQLARHYRDEIVPLRKHIADENLLRYNGMLIGVFELLADAREQILSVTQAIEAQRDFWLADAALQASLIGSPHTATRMPTP